MQQKFMQTNSHAHDSGAMSGNLSKKKRLENLEIPKPSAAEVDKYIRKWNDDLSLKHYVIEEKIVVDLFQTYPKNTCEEEVLVKVKTLNLFYNTGIINTTAVTKNILEIKDVDELLRQPNDDIIEKIANVTISGKSMRFYSFATKYCHHHHPTQYPIFDSFVSKALVHFNKQDPFYTFKEIDIRKYSTFENVILEFSKKYHLEKYRFRELDLYLWLLGKEKFPIKINDKTKKI